MVSKSRPVQLLARERSYRQRRIEVREANQRFLIVCEGERTEPNYFRAFRVPGLVIEIHGLGTNTVGLVRKAIEIRGDGRYDQTWCVFDKDSFPAQDFNAALQVAQANDIRVAYSNEAFEIWYLLHFHYYNTGMSRQSYCQKLDQLLGRPYRKNDEGIYELLAMRQDRAIRFAQRLLASYDPCRPYLDNPSTTVHLLVEQLRIYSD